MTHLRVGRRTGRPLMVLTAAVVLATGCGGATSASHLGTAGPPATGAAEANPETEPVVDGAGPPDGDGVDTVPPGSTEPQIRDASADALVGVTDLRVGGHDDFDRVVLEVAGKGAPGWDVRYVDEPSSQGSGAGVEVAGGAVLQVTVTGAGYPFDTGVEEYAGPRRVTADGTAAITEVIWDATFEGASVAFIGTAERAPFRVHLLEDPARVVVDVTSLG